MLRRNDERTKDRPDTGHRHRHRRRMRGLSLGFLLVLVTASLVGAWSVRNLVRDQEHGLLKARAAEVSLVLGNLISTTQTRLNLVGTVARVTDRSPQAFASLNAAPTAA